MDAIAAYYDRLAAVHGDTPAGCDATDWDALACRWDALMLPYMSAWRRNDAIVHGATLLDVGCGWGGITRRYFIYRYTGIDLSPQQVALAQSRGLDARVENVLNLTGTWDYVVAQGIFYKLPMAPEPATGYARSVENLLAACYARCRVCCSVSFLTESQADEEFPVDPAWLYRIARSLTPWTVLRQDYHPHDACLYLYREVQR